MNQVMRVAMLAFSGSVAVIAAYLGHPFTAAFCAFLAGGWASAALRRVADAMGLRPAE